MLQREATGAGEAPPLDYGRHSSGGARRRWIVVALGILLALVVWRVASPYATPYIEQASFLRLQRQISHQLWPPDTVVYTEDPAQIARVKNSLGYRRKRAIWGSRYAQGLPDAYERVVQNGAFPGSLGRSVERFQVGDTFGWLRTSRQGVPWIVHLDQVNPFAVAGGLRRVAFSQISFAPVGWSPGSRGACRSVMSKQVQLRPRDVLTFFAPQPTATDNACVQIPYELNGQRGVLRGTVQDDGYVDFAVDSGPAKVVKWNDPP